MATMFSVGECPSCHYGPLGIRVCSGRRHLVVMCDECDLIWTKIDAIKRVEDAYSPPQPSLKCPLCDGCLLEAPAHWASRVEIQQAGWWAAVEGESGASHE